MMASCTRCQHKFFITRNTFRGDPDGAENYLREKFVRHECPRQSGDAHKILRLWKTDQPHSARIFLEKKITILASAVEDEIHQLVRRHWLGLSSWSPGTFWPSEADRFSTNEEFCERPLIVVDIHAERTSLADSSLPHRDHLETCCV